MEDNGCDITTSELLQLQAQCKGKVDDITFATPDPSASPIVTPTESPSESPVSRYLTVFAWWLRELFFIDDLPSCDHITIYAD